MRGLIGLTALIAFLLAGCTTLIRAKHSVWGVTTITAPELRALIEKDRVTVLDVRDGPDWERSMFKITGAIRRSPDALDSWVNDFPRSAPIVVYCA